MGAPLRPLLFAPVGNWSRMLREEARGKVGRHAAAAIDRMHEVVRSVPAFENGVFLGLQPHAPYSCGLDVYRAAARFNLPLSTHLSETLQEIEFVESGTGLIAEMLRRIGEEAP